MRFHHEVNPDELTPEVALQFLKEGNERFLNNLRINRNMLQLVNETADGQNPFASILSCSDSRTSAELIFDQGLGDVFSVRLAGNIASIKAIGSLEFACKYLGTKLIVVLGHTNCGAVKGACDNLKDGHIHSILDHIKPAVSAESETTTNRNSGNKQFVNNVTHLNVQHQIQTILDNSLTIQEMINRKEVAIVGAMYDVRTGAVEFFDDCSIFELNNSASKPTEQVYL